jgi:hypothetical protein
MDGCNWTSIRLTGVVAERTPIGTPEQGDAHFSHTLFPSLARWVPPGMLCVRILDNVSSSHENRHAQHAAQNFSPQSGKNLLKFLQVLTPQGGRRSYRSVNSTSSNRHASSTALLRSNTCSD